jgi:restriction system protein
MLPVLRALSEGPVRAPELIGRMAAAFGLTEEERAKLLPSGRQAVINNRVHWALTYLHRAGLVERVRRGEYALSGPGRVLLDRPPERITLAFLTKHYPGVRAFRGETESTPGGETLLFEAPADSTAAPILVATPEERLSQAVAEMKAKLAGELLDRLRAMSPDAFEEIIVQLLIALGFGGGPSLARGESIGKSGDGGVDGVLREDALGLDVIYIQAKRNGADNAVGPDRIQAFAGSLLERGATKGVFATTSRFTDAAKKAAERLSTQRRIVLIDGEELARLMIEHGVGVRTVETIRIQRVDLSDYEEEE